MSDADRARDPDRVYIDEELDEALAAAREAAERQPDAVFRAGYLEGAEHVVRYLREQQQIDRLLID